MLKWVYHFLISLQFNHIYCMCGKSKVSFVTFWFFSLFELAMKGFHECLYIFLIHSGSVQKMLTALFKLVWNTQKST